MVRCAGNSSRERVYDDSRDEKCFANSIGLTPPTVAGLKEAGLYSAYAHTRLCYKRALFFIGISY